MSGHTTGPWHVAEDRNTNAPVVLDECSYTIARCLEPGEQRRANARLIAAAPELLEACRAALPLLKAMYAGVPATFGEGPVNALVERAIAKAESR